jgi:hypothetical protein
LAWAALGWANEPAGLIGRYVLQTIFLRRMDLLGSLATIHKITREQFSSCNNQHKKNQHHILLKVKTVSHTTSHRVLVLDAGRSL